MWAKAYFKICFWRQRGPRNFVRWSRLPFSLCPAVCCPGVYVCYLHRLSPCVFLAQLLENFGGGSLSGAAVAAMDLAGRTGGPASLPPPPLGQPAECAAGTGSCFDAKILLGDRFAGRIRAGETGCLGYLSGDKSKFTMAVDLAGGKGRLASLPPPPPRPPVECNA